MPTGFRLNFAQNRPSPRSSVTEGGRQSERSDSTSSTEFEKVSSPTTISSPLKHGFESPKPSTIRAAVNYVSKPSDPIKLDAPRTGLMEEEKQFAAEEGLQWSGELRRMATFTTYLESVTSTFSQNDEARCQKFQTLLDEQEAEYLDRESGRQESFTRDVNGFLAVAKENQSKWDINATFYEATRENLMKTGRQRRIIVKEAAEKELNENADEIQKEEQEAFEEEARKMDIVVTDLVDQAKEATERLFLEAAKAKANLPPGELNGQQPISSGTATGQTLPNAEPQSSFRALASISGTPRSISPFSHRSRSRTPSSRNISPIRPGPAPIIMQPTPPMLIARPRSRSPPSRHIFPVQPGSAPIIIQPPPPVVMAGPPFRSRSRSRSRSPPSPRVYKSPSHAEDPTILSLIHQRQTDWEKDEQARDQGEEKRREIFTSALSKIRANHTSSLVNLMRQSGGYDVRRANAETKREQEFEALLRTNRGSFDLFTASVEKKYAVLNLLEDEYDEQLKSDIRAAVEREEKALVRGRKRLSKRFEKLQVERRDKLMKAFDQLQQAKDTLEVTRSDAELDRVSSPGSAQEVKPDVSPGQSVPFPGVIPIMPGIVPQMPDMHVPPMMMVPPAVVMQRSRSSSRSRSRSRRRSRSRSRSPAVGFAPQALFKMRNVSTLPTPRRIVRTSAPESQNSIPSAQLSERARMLAESLSERQFIFAVNEANRQIVFEQAQVERKNLFNSIEYERESTFKDKLQEQKQRFWEAEQQMESTFIRRREFRNQRFVEEQRKMGKEYNEMEERLVRECSQWERERMEDMKSWVVKFVKDKQDQWEEDVQTEMRERNERFRYMTMEPIESFSFARSSRN